MHTPRILFKRPFSIADLRVEVTDGVWTAPAAYEDLVSTAWQEQLTRGGRGLWDGSYYRVRDSAELDNLINARPVRLGTIPYRFIATYRTLQDHHAPHEIGSLYHLTTAALIRTCDGYYVFGRRARDGQVDFVGGGLQSDEVTVASGKDVERNLYKEMREEIGLDAEDVAALTGIGAVMSSTSNVLIFGHAETRLSKDEIDARFMLREDEEFVESVYAPVTELGSFLSSLTDYRVLIPQLLSP